MTRTLEEALRAAGLDDDLSHLIAENRVLADLVARSAKEICENFRAAFVSVDLLHPTKYKGKFAVDRIPQIAATLRSKGKKPRQYLIARELGCSPGMLSKMIDRDIEIKNLYRAAIDDNSAT